MKLLFLSLVGLALSVSSIFAGPPQDHPFDSMAFTHYNGDVQFVRVTTQQRIIGDSAARNVTITAAEVKARGIVTVNGREVTDAELEAWTSTTVNARVKIDDTGHHFYGGEKPYQIIYAQPAPVQGGCSNGKCGIPQQGGCPNGRCPMGGR